MTDSGEGVLTASGANGTSAQISASRASDNNSDHAEARTGAEAPGSAALEDGSDAGAVTGRKKHRSLRVNSGEQQVEANGDVVAKVHKAHKERKEHKEHKEHKHKDKEHKEHKDRSGKKERKEKHRHRSSSPPATAKDAITSSPTPKLPQDAGLPISAAPKRRASHSPDNPDPKSQRPRSPTPPPQANQSLSPVPAPEPTLASPLAAANVSKDAGQDRSPPRGHPSGAAGRGRAPPVVTGWGSPPDLPRRSRSRSPPPQQQQPQQQQAPDKEPITRLRSRSPFLVSWMQL